MYDKYFNQDEYELDKLFKIANNNSDHTFLVMDHNISTYGLDLGLLEFRIMDEGYNIISDYMQYDKKGTLAIKLPSDNVFLLGVRTKTTPWFMIRLVRQEILGLSSNLVGMIFHKQNKDTPSSARTIVDIKNDIEHNAKHRLGISYSYMQHRKMYLHKKINGVVQQDSIRYIITTIRVNFANTTENEHVETLLVVNELYDNNKYTPTLDPAEYFNGRSVVNYDKLEDGSIRLHLSSGRYEDYVPFFERDGIKHKYGLSKHIIDESYSWYLNK